MKLASPSGYSFLGVDKVPDPASVSTAYAYLGIPFGPPYEPADMCVSSTAAQAVRNVTHRMEYDVTWDHYDFDLDGPLFPDSQPNVTDCGDVVGDVRNPDAISDRATDVISGLLNTSKTPLVIGGLDSIPPMVVDAFNGNEVVNVLHVDAHIDFRDDVHGVTHGYSSPIRRISEFPCTDCIYQVGLRSMGSARPQEVSDALAAGSQLVTAWNLREQGVSRFLDRLPMDKRWIISIDCDGLAPTIAPAVGWPEPGGLEYMEIATIVRDLARRNRIAAFIVTEFRPDNDVHAMTALTIARLLVNTIGLQRVPLIPNGH